LRDRLLSALIVTMLAFAPAAMAGGPTTLQIAATQGDGTMTAALMPGIGREAQVAPLPRPLSARDAETYARILKLQDSGQWAAADHQIGELKDDLLKGHVLARRYLDSGYRPKFQELRAWMADYADLPQAEAIYKLATTKGIKGFGALKPPVRGTLTGTGIDTSDDGANWEDSTFGADRGSAKARTLKVKYRQLLRQDEDGKATALFRAAEAQGLDAADIDEMKLMTALDHFAGGRDREAAELATEAAERSGEQMPAAHWVAGLSLWRQGNAEAARRHFEEVADASDASGWMVAAGAFWAARANLVSHRPEVVNHWLEVAATYPRTFYGLLARRVLGYETLFSWESAPFTETDADMLSRVPGGRRALALLQLGDRQAAEEELRKAYPRAGKALRQSMLSLAQIGEMPGLAVRLGGMNVSQGNDAAAFPIPEWNPKGGWMVEKALVFAFVRQESAFNPKARSVKGAGGLMQLMPATARAIAGQGARERISDPEYNLALGQRYLAHLLHEAPVNGNLLYLAAAYNAGPGKLGQWLGASRNNDDPLLFIEALPARQTRAFVERVMTNYWIYRSRLGQTADSLDQIATGAWPVYEGEGTPAIKLRRASTR